MAYIKFLLASTVFDFRKMRYLPKWSKDTRVQCTGNHEKWQDR